MYTNFTILLTLCQFSRLCDKDAIYRAHLGQGMKGDNSVYVVYEAVFVLHPCPLYDDVR